VRAFTAGGHNLHDEAGTPLANADLMFWTEAIPVRIKAAVNRARYRLVWDERDPSEVLGLNRILFGVDSYEWHRAHGGEAQVTPHRGTLVVRYHKRALRKRNRRRFGSMVSHRINGSEPGHRPPPPKLPGEYGLRERLYDQHYALDQRLNAELLAEGRDVINGGDYNRHGGNVFPPDHGEERGKGADRVFASKGLRLGPMRWGPKRGSDHPSWTVDVTPVG
jgi:hypothetical protein